MIISIKKILIQIIYLKIDEKSWKNIFIYYIGYVTIKKDLKICTANHFYLIFSNVSGYVEEINGSKYLAVFLTNRNKKIKNKKV